MSFTAYRPPVKTMANLATDMTYDTAVALRERFAALVSFQWHQPGLPPTQNVNSAPRSLASAC